MPGFTADRRGALTGLTSSCTSESLYKVSQRRTKGSRYEKAKLAWRAPGSLRENFTAGVTSLKLVNAFQNDPMVRGTCPCPPNTSLRVNPNSRFSVGLKLTFWPNMYGPAGN